MRVTNLSSTKELGLGWVEPHGIRLVPSGSALIDDKYASNASLISAVNSGLLSITGFNIGDSSDYVSNTEFESFVKGLFTISSWTKSGTIAKGTAATMTGNVTGIYDLSEYNVLNLKFDGLYTVLVEFTKAQHLPATIVSELNANTSFAKYATASVSTGFVKITNKSCGVNSSIEILPEPRSCATTLGLSVDVNGTGTVFTVTIVTKNTGGEGVSGITHAVKLYNANTGTVACTKYMIQRVSKGVATTLYTGESSITTGENGQIEFEVSYDDETPDSGCYLDVEIPATHFLATKPVSRLIVVATA